MDDTLCREFFLRPTQTRHRRYEALRAYFVDHRPLPEIAQAFGYRYGTLRNLVTEFRAQCRADHLPPFSLRRHAAVPEATAITPEGLSRNSP
jgi:hypothetical protein